MKLDPEKLEKKLTRTQKILDAFKGILITLGGIAGLIGAGFLGVQTFFTKTFKALPAKQAETKLLDVPANKEVIDTLHRIAVELDATRAFIYIYGINNTQEVEIFRTEYQWQEVGLTPIPEAAYPLAPGASTTRFRSLHSGDCLYLDIDKMETEDPLRIAFLSSGSTRQFVCPIILPQQGGLGGIAVEFDGRDPLNPNTQRVLLREGAAIAQLLSKK